MRYTHKTLVIIAGATWGLIGLFLLTLGLKFIFDVAKDPVHASGHLLPKLAPHLGGKETAAVCLITLALLIGYVKGRFVLVKSVKRVVNRILTLPNPAHLSKLYHLPYYLLMAAMVGLGVLIKYLGIPLDIRGAVDVAVGSALINGALIYFRFANGLSRLGS